MPEVCNIISNCCCQQSDKITDKLNVDADAYYRKPITLQSTYHLDNFRNSPVPEVNKAVIRRNYSEADTNAFLQNEFKPMRRVFTSNSQMHKEVILPNEQSPSQAPSIHHNLSEKVVAVESPDIRAQDYLNIAGYQNYRLHPTMNVSHNMKPMLEGNHGYPPQTQTKRAKCGFGSFCCPCCCEVDEHEGFHNGPVKGNRAIIMQPIRRERIVEVMVEEIQERVINVPQIQYVDKFVEVPKPVFQYKIKEVKRPVIVEKVVKVDKVVEEDKIIEVPEIKYVEKEVSVPVYVKKERIVEVPLPIVKERRIPVLKVKKSERYQEVDNVNYNDFEIGLSAIKGDDTEIPKVPNNTPLKRNQSENGNEDCNNSNTVGEKMIQEVIKGAEGETPKAEYTANAGATHSFTGNETCEQIDKSYNVAAEKRNHEFKIRNGKHGTLDASPRGIQMGSNATNRSTHRMEDSQRRQNNDLTVLDLMGRTSHRTDECNLETNLIMSDTIDMVGSPPSPSSNAQNWHQFDGTVSIYPNIAALSMTSSYPNDDTPDEYMRRLSDETNRLVMSYQSSGAPSETYVRITKPTSTRRI